VEEYAGRILLVVKYAPYPYRDFARVAARASLAAREQGRFWEMHELLLENSRTLNAKTIAGLAAALGLDPERFQEDLDSKRLVARVEEDVALTRSLNLYQTPTFVIGPTGRSGRVLVGERPIEHLRKAIDEELASAGAPP
jgi:protein-disulfide isomerase